MTRSVSLTWFLRSGKGSSAVLAASLGRTGRRTVIRSPPSPELQARALRTPGRNPWTPADGSPDSGPKSLDSSPDSGDDPPDSSAKSLESGMLKTELQRARTRSSELARPDSSELRTGLQRPTPGTSSRTPGAGGPDSSGSALESGPGVRRLSPELQSRTPAPGVDPPPGVDAPTLPRV